MVVASASSLPTAMPPASPRLPLLDLARGWALVAMAVYHFTWDLALFGFILPETPFQQPFLGLARLTAASFLLLVGVSLVAAMRNGVRAWPFLKRLLVVGGAAGLVTLGTWFATPDVFVRFGILHLIAAASVVALPFVRLPAVLSLVAAALVFSAGWLWTGDPGVPLVALPLLAPADAPSMSDYTPLLPWVGFTLLGVALGRWVLRRGFDQRLARFRFEGRGGRLLRLGGRHSLLVYLLHQPLLMGLLAAAAMLAEWMG